MDKKSHRIGFRISTLMDTEIKKTAKKHDIAVAKVIHACLEEGLKHSKMLTKLDKDADAKELTVVIAVSEEFFIQINELTEKLQLRQAELLRRALVIGLKSA